MNLMENEKPLDSTAQKNSVCFGIRSFSDCQKSLAEFAPAGANKFLIIFSGDMRVG